MSFLRRYQYFPGTETITLIEGIVTIDLPPPGQIQGVGTGTTAMVGEYPDVSYATQVNPATGAISTFIRPVECFSAQDMINKVGGFDATLGEFGISCGNAFVALRNKVFSRLICVPVNNASGFGARLTRELPTNTSATNTLPVVPMQAASVAAGTEFKSGSNRVRIAQSVSFSSAAAYTTGIDGVAAPSGLPTATQAFTSASGDFVNQGVQVGDAVVIGVIGASGAQGTDSDTYRVNAVTSATALVLERQDGSSFTTGNWVAGTALAWRLHQSNTADSGGAYTLSSDQGYPNPCRPLDATIAATTNCTPTIVPPAITGTSWDPLSGLNLKATSNAAGIAYTAAIQAPNVASSGSMDALYQTAIDALLGEDLPARDVNILLVARTSATIRGKQKSHVLNESAVGVGRTTVCWPPVNMVSTNTALGDSSPGVGATRNERVDYSWPGAQTSIPEAVNFSIKTALGTFTTDGILDVPADAFLGSVMSNLAPERNPGQQAAPVPALLAGVAGIQRGVSGLGINEYTQFRQRGIAALKIDRTVGPIFQSGITSSLIPGEKNINRRRMADFIEDSVASSLTPFNKLPLTDDLKDSATSEVISFLNGLLSPNNPKAQRISSYLVDDKSGNTPELETAGIFVIIGKVRTLATADFIVLQWQVGEGVNTNAT